MRGAVYTWHRICTAPYTHGAVYTWSHILVGPAHSLCSHLAVLAPWAYLGPWNFPGVLKSLQLTPLTPSLLPSLLACSPYSLSICGSLGPSWGLRKSPAHSPCSQLAPLAPWASLGFWNFPGALGSSLPSLPACSPCSQLAPLTSSLLPLPPEHL